MPIDSNWLFFQKYGFSREQFLFATNPRPDSGETEPESLREKMAGFESMAAPGLTGDQIHQASGRFTLSARGTELPGDWPTKDFLRPTELKPTDVAREAQDIE